jgi:hypothetical protein
MGSCVRANGDGGGEATVVVGIVAGVEDAIAESQMVGCGGGV